MRMAEIPEQAAPGPGALPIPAVEEVLLLEDRQEQRLEQEEAALHPGALPQEVLPEEAAQEAAQGGLRAAVPGLLLPVLEIIIMKQDVLLAGVAEDAGARISEKSQLAA